MSQNIFFYTSLILFFIILGLAYSINQLLEKKSNLQSRINKVLEGRDISFLSQEGFKKVSTKQTLIEKKLKQYLLRNPKKAEQFNLWLHQSGLKLEMRILITIFLLTWCITFLAVKFFISLNIFLAIIGSFIGHLFLFYIFIEYMVSRQRTKIINELAHAVDIIARGIKAGSTIEKTFPVVIRETKPPLKEEFIRMVHELDFGIPFEKVIHSAAHRINVPDFFFFASALIIQRRSGGGLYEVLENIVTMLHKTKEIRMKIKVFSAESKGSAVILTSIPFVVWAIVMRTNSSYLEFFLHDPLGKKLLILVFGLVAATVISVKKIIKFEV
ncbi:hypothetical protein IM40_03505 [Candidatus Paracaedimonas acanthamoebae]|nr:hypothetical protein IM40_03505 [Candidatus Paracaedimonas acanthamoebae]